MSRRVLTLSACVLLSAPVCAAVPDSSPRAALKALEGYGQVPECWPEEDIHSDSAAYGGHRHEFRVAKPIARIDAKSAEIEPYLDHWSEAVVARAARLLCFSPKAKPAIARLIARSPCLRWVGTLARATGQPSPNCGERRDEPLPYGYQALQPKSPPAAESARARTLAQRISGGDAEAVREALWESTAMDFARRQSALLALTRVDTVVGVSLILHAYIDEWEKDQLVNHAMGGGMVREWERESFKRDVLKPALVTTAAKQKMTREEVFVRAAGTFAPDQFENIANATTHYDELFYAAGRFARSAAGNALTAPGELAFKGFLNRYTQGNDPVEIGDEAVRIRGLRDQKNAFELDKIATGRGLDFHRMLAAVYLTQLGEARGLWHLDQKPPLTLHDANAIRAEVKALYENEKAGPRKERLKALFEKWDQHCKMNDCSKVSPH